MSGSAQTTMAIASKFPSDFITPGSLKITPKIVSARIGRGNEISSLKDSALFTPGSRSHQDIYDASNAPNSTHSR